MATAASFIRALQACSTSSPLTSTFRPTTGTRHQDLLGFRPSGFHKSALNCDALNPRSGPSLPRINSRSRSNFAFDSTICDTVNHDALENHVVQLRSDSLHVQPPRPPPSTWSGAVSFARSFALAQDPRVPPAYSSCRSEGSTSPFNVSGCLTNAPLLRQRDSLALPLTYQVTFQLDAPYLLVTR